MKKLLLTTAMTLALTSPALAGKTPRPGSADARVKTFTYHDRDVYRITAHYGFSTVLEFAPTENIETIALGDSDAWQTIKPGRNNLLFIKPLEQNASTNMTVVTNERIYTFELSAKSAQSHRSTDLSFRIKFIYPELIDLELANIGKSKNNGFNPKEFTPSSVAPENWNLKYSYSGSKNLRPIRAFDDGIFTYLQFSNIRKAPAVFSVDEQGNEAIVNYSMRGKYLVVESLARQFTLRDGNDSTCIFNDDFPEIKTVSADGELNKMEERIALNHAPRTPKYND
ncbi:MAG: P-type conjugative transfer protein VirB9 [Alphaproteobacteria bacterium]|nr:P-type conjugative transfer protein VirB9 [Alphaproteobacteria bacterium]